MINTDGTAYAEYEVRTTNNNVITSDLLYLYSSPGSTVLLSSTTQDEALLPGPIIPDGQGGLLATWTISPSNPPVLQYPYQAAEVSAGVVGTPYNLPFSPQSVTPFVSPTLVLGENGVAFASGTTTATVNGTPTQVSQVASFNLSSGAPNWTYQATAGDTLSIIEATAGGGVTVNNSNTGVFNLNSSGISNSNSRASRLAGNASSSTVSSLPSGAVPFDLSTWVSAAAGALTALWNPNGTNGIPTLLAQSASPQKNGNQQGQSLPPYCQRKNVNCALAPVSDMQVGPNQDTIQVRQVKYSLFNLQNGTLKPLVGPSQNPPPVKIELWEAHATSSSAIICDWQTNNPASMCESPNDHDGSGQFTDNMGAMLIPYTVDQQFLVDRQGVQVFWPNSNGSWYGAWGAPSSPPPGFQPNQTSNTTIGWATISQINPNTNAPAACSKTDCDTMLPQAGPPSK